LLESRRGHGGGTFVVAPLTMRPGSASADGELGAVTATMKDTLALRRILEPGAAALAATRTLTAADRATLHRCLHDASDCDPAARRLADSRLHMAIADAGDSPSVVAVVPDVQMRVTGRLWA